LIVDSSALLAIIFQEPNFETCLEALGAASSKGIGAPTAVESGIVVGRRLGFKQPWVVHRVLQEANIAVIDFESRHWTEAVRAYDHFGRGRHPAALNFGDCLTYAVAKLAAQPLLCVGDDFTKTDLELVPT